MSRALPLVLLGVLLPASALPDSSNPEGDVLIAHHPPGPQYTSGQDWCARYFEEFAIDGCAEQNNEVDPDGNHGRLSSGSTWHEPAAVSRAAIGEQARDCPELEMSR